MDERDSGRQTLAAWIRRQRAARALSRRTLLGGIGGLGGLTLLGCSSGSSGGSASAPAATTGTSGTGTGCDDHRHDDGHDLVVAR